MGELWSQNIFTNIRNHEFIGARPMSMAETFVAIADDINALYWNPAGLPILDHLGINSMHSNLFQSGIGCNYLALCIPGLPKTSIGFDWMNISFSDEEFDYSKNKFNFSGGYQLFKWLSIGFNMKYIRMNSALDKRSQGTFQGWGSDWGFLCSLSPKLNLGLVVYDITNTTLKGISSPVYRQNIRVGAAYKLFDNLLIATDIDDRFHLGSEWWLFNKLLALRGGLQQDFHTDEPITFSCGVGMDIPLWGQRIRFDYAFTNASTLPNTHRTSLSFLIDLFPRLVKIKNVNIEPVYASLYKYHSQHPIGKVDIEYEGKKDLDCTVSVTVNKYSEERTKNIILSAKSTIESTQKISINATFLDSVLYEPDNIPLTAAIKISYMSGNRPKEEKINHIFHLYNRNSIDWQHGVEQAAAFVTPNDPSVIRFNWLALSDENILNQNIIKSDQFTKSVCLFDAASKHGVRYEEDSYSPYSKTYQAFDNIKYPAQLLKHKRGDCDDLCVLFASLFENRNIPTALVSIPEHIFILFNTGIHPSRSFQLCCANNQYYEYQDQLWIPLETTLVNKSFYEAWAKGAELINQFSEDEMQIIAVRDAWEQYEPVAYFEKSTRPFRNIPDQNFAQEKSKIEQSSQQYLIELEKKVSQLPDSSHLRNHLAITYAYQNQFKNAEKHFRILLAKDSTNFFAINNIGNLFFLQGNLDSAQCYYQKAQNYAKGKYKDGINLNLGLLYASADIDSMAIEMFTRVIRDSTDYSKIGELLGIVMKENELVKGEGIKPKKKVSVKKVKQLSTKALNKNKKQHNLKKKKRSKKFVNLGAKGYQPNEKIENIFFWAY